MLHTVERALGDWLSKPVGNLINRMNSAAKRPPTRGSVQESSMGHDIFVCSAYVPADEFVSVTDDVELVDFVAKDSSKKSGTALTSSGLSCSAKRCWLHILKP